MSHLPVLALLLAGSAAAQVPTPSSPPISSATDDIRGLKPALEIREGSGAWPLAAAGAGALALGAGAAWLWRRRKRVPLSPTARFHEGLLLADDALADGDIAAWADRLIDAVWTFVEDTTGIPTEHLTTGELLDALEDRLPDPLHTTIRAQLELCDSVRFAGIREVPDAELPWLDDFVTALLEPEAPAEDTDNRAAM